MRSSKRTLLELSLVNKFKLLLSMVALLGCLLAASQLHAHEAGLHDIDHICLSCDLEDVASHGIAPENLSSLTVLLQDSLATSQNRCFKVLCQSFSQIRAPPA